MDHVASLTSLQLAGIFPTVEVMDPAANRFHSLQPFLAYLPNLQYLELHGPAGPYSPTFLDDGQPNPFPFPVGEPVEVPNLIVFISTWNSNTDNLPEGRQFPPSYTPGFLLPKLQGLTLTTMDYTPFLFPPSLPLTPNSPNSNTADLTLLSLFNPPSFDTDAFIDHLQYLPSLMELFIDSHSVSSLDGIVNALAAPIGEGTEEEEEKVFLCPDLEMVQFLHSLVGGQSLRKLVASRATPEEYWNGEVEPPQGRKLQTMDVKGALGVFLSEDESWMRNRVCYFTGRDDAQTTGGKYRKVRGDI